MNDHSIPLGLYQHWKGLYYHVLFLAHESETGETIVVYVPLYPHEGHGVAVHTLANFTKTVKVSGKEARRFQYIGSDGFV